MNEFGNLVRKERKNKDISLRKFAEMMGVSPTYISLLERGELNPPSEELTIKIADSLSLDRDYLLGKAGKVSSDIINIIISNPIYFADQIRSLTTTEA